MKKEYRENILMWIALFALIINLVFSCINNNRTQTEFEIRTRPYLFINFENPLKLNENDTYVNYSIELIIENIGTTPAKINRYDVTPFNSSKSHIIFEDEKESLTKISIPQGKPLRSLYYISGPKEEVFYYNVSIQYASLINNESYDIITSVKVNNQKPEEIDFEFYSLS